MTTQLNTPGPPDRIEGRAVDRLTLIAVVALVAGSVLAYLLRDNAAVAGMVVTPLVSIAVYAASSLGTRRTRTEPQGADTTPLDVTPAVGTLLTAGGPPPLDEHAIAGIVAAALAQPQRDPRYDTPAGHEHASAEQHDAWTDTSVTYPTEPPILPTAAATPPPFTTGGPA